MRGPSVARGTWRALGLVMSAVCGAGAPACAPRTDLVGSGEGPGGRSSDGALVLASPAAGEEAVPLNLRALSIRLPMDAEPPPVGSDAVRITGGPAPVPMLGQAPVACDGAAHALCWPFVLGASLRPSTRYEAALVSSLPLAGGGVLGPAVIGAFTTAAAPDEKPPGLTVLAVDVAGPCVHLSLSVDEPASIFVLLGPPPPAGADQTAWPAGQGVGDFDAWIPSRAWAGAATLQVQAVDRAGNVGAAPAVSLALPDIPALALTEILANPAGPEPAQEFVELLNVGDAPVELGGLWLEDGRGHDVLPATRLDPGAFALIVPSAFDPTGPGDVPVKAGTPLIRVDARLGGDGLSNDRDVVRLRLPEDGPVVSGYDGAIATGSAAWNGQSLHRRRGSVCDNATSWSTVPSPPTPGWE